MNRDIAIIGISGRFPLADNADELFDILKDGIDCVDDISEERIKLTTLPPDRPYRKCGYLKDIDKFDHKLFGISLAEAKAMCPEQRLLLEMVYAAIENSGYSPNHLSGTNTAVFVSTIYPTYPDHASEFLTTLVIGNSPEFLAAKIGRHFNLKGNVAVIDTTCSSSLVAVHTACNELITGDAEMAIVAGVSLQLFPFLDEEGGLDTESPDGRSKAFSIHADGMSYGEVAAAILLKPLDQAINDKDNIQAVIKGTSVNYNGNCSSSITAPDSQSQAEVFLKAWKKAGIQPQNLSYIEAHGSGTQLGDSLEFEALNLAFNAYTSSKHICPISTIKSNAGHGRNVSGLAGLLKTVLSLKNKVLFPTIHFEAPSPLLDYENSCVYVNKEFRFWSLNGNEARYAGVTSLGASGTNCHIVLQEAQDIHPLSEVGRTDGEQSFHIPVSGKTSEALYQNISALLTYLTKKSDFKIEDISYTLSKGRNHYEYRWSHIASTTEQLIQILRQDLDRCKAMRPSITATLIFVFSDSSLLSATLVDFYRKKYEAFETGWQECYKISPLENSALQDFAFQYSYYRLLDSIGITTEIFLPIGIGNIIRQVIDQEITLAEGLDSAKEYKSYDIPDKEERLQKIINKFTQDGNVTFLDIAVHGILSELLHGYNALQDGVYFIAHNKELINDPLLDVIQSLYVRKVDNSTQFGIEYNSIGKRIELPAYQFEKTRCWLREKPKETAVNNEAAVKSKYLLKEKAGNIENKLAEIFASILNVDELSIYDNFFESGGDSLKATNVISEVNRVFNLALNFEDIFDFPQISSLSEYLNGQLDTASKVKLVWQTVLQNDNLTGKDDFFELGGHSLMATQIIVLLNNEFNVDLNFEDIFQHPTMESLSKYIESIKKSATNKVGITPAERKASYNLTYAQSRMWFLSNFVGEHSAYNNVFGIYLEGELKYEDFDRAVYRMVQRHESLRTIFRMEEDAPRQIILNNDEVYIKTEIVDIQGSEIPDSIIVKLFEEENNYVFDLSKLPLFRIRLIRTGENRHICIYNIHHIISDGWSIGVFVEDFCSFYNHIVSKKEDALPPMPVQIKDYAEWQRTQEFEDILRVQESYWLKLFEDTIPVLSLPIDKARPTVQSFEGNTSNFIIGRQQLEQLKNIAKDHGATLYMVLLSIYNILLGKLSGSEDILVGSPVAGRRFDGLQALIGLFVNTIVLRNKPKSNLEFSSFLSSVKRTSLEALNNQDYPYEELVKKLLIERDTSRNPIFDTLFILQNNRNPTGDFGSVKATSYPVKSATARFDLLIEALERDGQLEIDFEYSTALFHKSTIERFITYFKKIVSAVIENVNTKIADIKILDEEERNLIINGFNNTTVKYQSDRTITSIFEEVVNIKNDDIAITFEEASLSYKELNKKSNQLSRRILQKRTTDKGVIGILMPRSLEMIASIIAVLKTGYAYVPIDPDYPFDRIQSIIDDSTLDTILVAPSTKKIFERLKNKMHFIDVTSADLSIEETENLGNDFSSSSLAYLIYTSGSTGNPKGVMVQHNNVVNFIKGVTDKIDFTSSNSILGLTTISFDIFVLETILPLLTGMRIVLANADEQKDPTALVKLINSQDVNLVQITPSHIRMLISSQHGLTVLERIKVLMVGGEAFPLELLREIKKNFKGRIYNMYGPTETTVWSTIQDLTSSNTINIGKPIANTTIRILDKDGKLQPIGIHGELCIGGEGVSRGYWNNIQLTRDKFIIDPIGGNQRIYRTGDLAMWLPSGDIQFLGRIDTQVKIRGYRIELGEIENQLVAFSSIKEAVVVAKEKGGDKYLVGYYTSESKISEREIREWLHSKLPYYMVPSYLVCLEEIPLTPNGKLNRRGLPDPEFKIEENYCAPLSETEIQLVQLWSSILHIDSSKIGIHSDFFASGGHSILAVKLIYSLEQKFSINISLRQIFECATIAKQSALIEATGTQTRSTIPKIVKSEFYPVSSAQERLYYGQMLNEKNLTYNISSAYKIEGELNIGRLRKSFQSLVSRHDGFRTRFSVLEESIVQQIEEELFFDLDILDKNKYDSVRGAFDDFVRPFDLSKCPLMRCALLQHEVEGNLLFVDIHHIICDGVSLNILMNDFKNIYAENELSRLELAYVDYASWQRNQKDILLKQKEFWYQQLSGELPSISLPTIRDKGDVNIYRAVKRNVELNKDVYLRLKKLAAELKVSDFMLLLSAYYILVSKMSGNSDIIIGTDAIGRTQAALKNIVGTFVNVLPLRVHVTNDVLYRDFLDKVKDCVLEAFDNQEYQYDQMIALLSGNARNNVVEIHFSFANYFNNESEFNDLNFIPFSVKEYETTQYEFKIEIHEEQDKFNVLFIFSSDLYDYETIELIKGYFYNIIASILDDSTVTVGEIVLEMPANVMVTSQSILS